MGVQKVWGIPPGKVLVSFRDLERGVCSSIDHLRSRIREPEGGSATASVSEFGERFDGCLGIHRCPGISGNSFGAVIVLFGDLERGVCSSIDHLRSRIREPEGGSAPASVGGFGKRFDGRPGIHCPGIQRVC